MGVHKANEIFALRGQAEGTIYDGKDESTEIYWGDGGRYYGNDDYALWGFGSWKRQA